MSFEDGLPFRLNGQPVTPFTPRLAKAPLEIRKKLAEATQMPCRGNSVYEAIDYLMDSHDLSFRFFRPSLPLPHVDLDQKVNFDEHGIPLSVGLMLLLEKAVLACDYHYEQLLITTNVEARTWTDRTGVQTVFVIVIVGRRGPIGYKCVIVPGASPPQFLNKKRSLVDGGF